MKSKDAKLKKKLDNLAREYVLLRDNNTCQKCGKYQEKNANWSHVIPRSNGLRLKWNPMNSKVLCTYCHKSFWHASPIESGKWFADKFPERAIYLQEQKAKGIKKWRISELEELIDWFLRAIENFPEEIDYPTFD